MIREEQKFKIGGGFFIFETEDKKQCFQMHCMDEDELKHQIWQWFGEECLTEGAALEDFRKLEDSKKDSKDLKDQYKKDIISSSWSTLNISLDLLVKLIEKNVKNKEEKEEIYNSLKEGQEEALTKALDTAIKNNSKNPMRITKATGEEEMMRQEDRNKNKEIPKVEKPESVIMETDTKADLLLEIITGLSDETRNKINFINEERGKNNYLTFNKLTNKEKEILQTALTDKKIEFEIESGNSIKITDEIFYKNISTNLTKVSKLKGNNLTTFQALQEVINPTVELLNQLEFDIKGRESEWSKEKLTEEGFREPIKFEVDDIKFKFIDKNEYVNQGNVSMLKSASVAALREENERNNSSKIGSFFKEIGDGIKSTFKKEKPESSKNQIKATDKEFVEFESEKDFKKFIQEYLKLDYKEVLNKFKLEDNKEENNGIEISLKSKRFKPAPDIKIEDFRKLIEIARNKENLKEFLRRNTIKINSALIQDRNIKTIENLIKEKEKESKKEKNKKIDRSKIYEETDPLKNKYITASGTVIDLSKYTVEELKKYLSNEKEYLEENFTALGIKDIKTLSNEDDFIEYLNKTFNSKIEKGDLDLLNVQMKFNQKLMDQKRELIEKSLKKEGVDIDDDDLADKIGLSLLPVGRILNKKNENKRDQNIVTENENTKVLNLTKRYDYIENDFINPENIIEKSLYRDSRSYKTSKNNDKDTFDQNLDVILDKTSDKMNIQKQTVETFLNTLGNFQRDKKLLEGKDIQENRIMREEPEEKQNYEGENGGLKFILRNEELRTEFINKFKQSPQYKEIEKEIVAENLRKAKDKVKKDMDKIETTRDSIDAELETLNQNKEKIKKLLQSKDLKEQTITDLKEKELQIDARTKLVISEIKEIEELDKKINEVNQSLNVEKPSIESIMKARFPNTIKTKESAIEQSIVSFLKELSYNFQNEASQIFNTVDNRFYNSENKGVRTYRIVEEMLTRNDIENYKSRIRPEENKRYNFKKEISQEMKEEREALEILNSNLNNPNRDMNIKDDKDNQSVISQEDIKERFETEKELSNLPQEEGLINLKMNKKHSRENLPEIKEKNIFDIHIEPSEEELSEYRNTKSRRNLKMMEEKKSAHSKL